MRSNEKIGNKTRQRLLKRNQNTYSIIGTSGFKAPFSPHQSMRQHLVEEGFLNLNSQRVGCTRVLPPLELNNKIKQYTVKNDV